jgi:microcystin-dependent protein
MSQTHREDDLFQMIQRMNDDIERLKRRRAIAIGAILIWPTTVVAPSGTLDCDGAAYSRTDYAELFARVGVRWGPGDGLTTFNVPTFKNCFLLGDSDDRVVGESGGEEEHTLIVEELPQHRHTGTMTTGPGATSSTTDGVPPHNSTPSGGQWQSSIEGNDQPHNNMPPFAVVRFVIVAL